jgi:predicted ATPase
VFNAERYNVGRCALVDTDILHPNCQNLPAVLFKLNKNKIAFEKFNDFVSQIFPSIKSVTVSQSGQDLEIFVYTVETMRPDLAVSLSESGTGIAQVLSIVYVLMTQRRSVIAIDEPNSFLHPGAVKKLSEIMQVYNLYSFPRSGIVSRFRKSDLRAVGRRGE